MQCVCSLLRRSLSIMTSPSPAPRGGNPKIHLMAPWTTLPYGSNAETTSVLQPNLPSASPVLIPKNGVDYRGKVVLAPMVRSGELPSRLLALHYGADLVWGPETVDRAMIGTTMHTNSRTGCLEWTRSPSHNNAKVDTSEKKDSVIYRIDPVRERGKLIYQIGTASPDLAVQAATLVAPYVAGIDVNAGCPKPFSTSGGMGAALLRTPDLLASILSSLVSSVGVPYQIGISVKIRLLETPELTSQLVHTICATGIIGLTIHCRTTPMRPRERAVRDQLRMIANICHSYGVACLMNGDVTSRAEALELARYYGVDGAMIATAAEANSSVFLPKSAGGPLPWREVVREYLKLAIIVENKWGNTKFLLSQLMPGKDKTYQSVTMSKSYTEVLNILSITDLDTLATAAEVDRILGLDERRPGKKELKRDRKTQEQRQREQSSETSKKQRRGLDQSSITPQKYADDPQHESVRSDHNHHTNSKNRQAKAKEAAKNVGHEGIDRGAIAVAA